MSVREMCKKALWCDVNRCGWRALVSRHAQRPDLGWDVVRCGEMGWDGMGWDRLEGAGSNRIGSDLI